MKRLVKEIKNTIKRYLNIKYFFRSLQLLAAINIALTALSFDGINSFKDIILRILYIVLCIVSASVIQEIGAVVTRLLYHYKLLRRRNVMHFISEILRAAE